MANLNKVMLIGRLTAPPEAINAGGSKGAKFRFAVNNRRRTPEGQWEDVPVYIDCEAWNRGDFGRTADTVLNHLDKGRQIFIEGHLKFEQWEKDGVKRNRLSVVVDRIEFLDGKGGEGEEGGSSRPMARAGSGSGASRGGSNGSSRKPARATPQFEESVEDDAAEHGDEQIPF
jgi:single-strand DNA-binding protein